MDFPTTGESSDTALRTKLRRQLEQSGMATAVRKMVREICNERDGVDDINPDEVINEVYRRGLMKSFIKDMSTGQRDRDEKGKPLGLGETVENSESDSSEVKYYSNFPDGDSSRSDLIEAKLRKSGRYYMKMEIRGGKAFLNHLLDESDTSVSSSSTTPGNNSCGAAAIVNERAKLVLHVFYKSQRFISKPVECRCDPEFKEVFLIDMGRFDDDADKSVTTKLLYNGKPLRIMVVREDANLCLLGGAVVGRCIHDWRSILVAEEGVKNFPLEIMGIGPEHNICVGILLVHFNLIPVPRERVSEDTYLRKMNEDIAAEEDRERSFITTTKRWWKEYIEIRADHQFRLIRIFAYDEKMVARPVTTFIKPVVVDDLLATPFHAAWFVALLPTNENATQCSNPNSSVITRGEHGLRNRILPGIQNGIGGCLLSERWQNVESTLISKSGTVEDHAVLLTCLLLNFGLDAYVALGEKKGKGSWAWTVTMSETQEPTFWESTTGDYYNHYSYPEEIGSFDNLPQDILTKLAKNKTYRFLSVSCMFNDKGLYANIQPTIAVDFVDWNLKNPSKWKHLLAYEDYTVNSKVFPIPLNNSVMNWDFMAKKLEFQLKNFIALARKENGLGTKWNERLAQFMGQHLAREEMQVSTGGSRFIDHFRVAALKSLPPGYEFRAHTFHSQSMDSFTLFEKVTSHQLGEKLLVSRGDDVWFTLKVKIFPYPEGVTSVRLMLACKYIPT